MPAVAAVPSGRKHACNMVACIIIQDNTLNIMFSCHCTALYRAVPNIETAQRCFLHRIAQAKTFWGDCDLTQHLRLFWVQLTPCPMPGVKALTHRRVSRRMHEHAFVRSRAKHHVRSGIKASLCPQSRGELCTLFKDHSNEVTTVALLCGLVLTQALRQPSISQRHRWEERAYTLAQ